MISQIRFECVLWYKTPIWKSQFGTHNKMWTVTSMLVTDVGDQMCWWQAWDVGYRFRIFVIDLKHWENRQHNGKRRQHNGSSTNISKQSPPSSQQHNDVTNITVTQTLFFRNSTLKNFWSWVCIFLKIKILWFIK